MPKGRGRHSTTLWTMNNNRGDASRTITFRERRLLLFFGDEFLYCRLRGKDMSHYTEVKSSFSAENETELIEACKELWPDATILIKTETFTPKVRGWPNTTQQSADVVVRFRNPSSEKQGNYDIGFQKKEDGSYGMVADWYACTYPEVTNDDGRVGSTAVEGMIKPIYTRRVMTKQVKNNPALRGFKNITKKGDYVTRKNKDGKEVKYARLRFQRSGMGV